jgi:hypothetical protein
VLGLDGDRDVVDRREPRKQARRLEDDAPIGAGPGDLAAAEDDAAAVGRDEPRHHRQHRGFAAARMADDADELALGDVEPEAFDDALGAERFSDVPDLEKALHGATRAARAVAARDRRSADEDIKNSMTCLRTSL